MGGNIYNDIDQKLLSLPTRFGGLAVSIYSVNKAQIKRTKQVIKKEKVDQCYISLDQLRNNLS